MINPKPVSLRTTGTESVSVTFPDVCKVPAPPAPFVPVPYPNTQYKENLKKANEADSRAKAGDKIAMKKVEVAIKSAYQASRGDEAGIGRGTTSGKTRGTTSVNIQSATQAVMYGHTLHTKYNTGNAPPGTRIVPSQIKVTVP